MRPDEPCAPQLTRMSTQPKDLPDGDSDFLGKSRLGESSLRQHAMRGFAWNAGWRWGIRLISIASTIILARLLTPYDFGLYTMAMIVVNFVEMFTQTGHLLALIRMENPTREHFDTAWTMQALIGLALGFVIIAVAPAARRYFGVDEVATLLYFVSLRTMIGGLVNVGTVTFRINLDYAKECQLGLLHRFLFFVQNVILALLLRNYWALAIGVVGGNVILVILSYLMHSYRPRFSLSKLRELWSFSFWVLVSYVSEYTGRRLDEVVVGGLVAPTQMGYYNAASESAAAPVSDLMDPIARALFPIYARFSTDSDRLLVGYLNSLSVGAIVAISTSVGLALISPDFIHVLLGSQWDSAAVILQFLALSGIGAGLAHGIPTVLTAAGRMGLNIAVVWMRILVVMPCLVFAGRHWGTVGVAVAQASVLLLIVPVWLWALSYVIPLRLMSVLSRLWRPVIAAAVMALAIESLMPLLPGPSLLRLVALTIAGAAAYFVTLLALWIVAGRPEGAEDVMATILGRLVERARLWWARPFN